MSTGDDLFATLVQTSPDGIVICGLDGRVEYLSESGRRMFLVTDADLEGGLNLFGFLHGEEHLSRARYYLSELMAGRPSGFADYRVVRQDGTPFWAEANAALLPPSEGEPERLFLIFRDITRRKNDEAQLRQYALELEELNHRLQALSTTDPLTGLLNRRQLDDSVGQECARCGRTGGTFSVAMIDIDYFKRFNDRFGHAAGDQVLSAVAELIRTSVRRNDRVFRYGGEEVLVLLPDTPARLAAVPLEGLRTAVARQVHEHRGRTLPPVTISIGVTDWTGPDQSFAELIDAADRVLYRAKAEGRNRVACGG